MSEQCSRTDTIGAVSKYYKQSEIGYQKHLGRRCHYGFSDLEDDKPFNITSAQIAMERKLGRTLGLPVGSQVLDAGCGYSPVGRLLTQEFGLKIAGTDLIPRRLQEARVLNTDANTSINLFNADYHHLPLLSESYDGVFTLETLVHAYDYKQVLSEFFRILRPGGKVVLFEYSIPPLDSVPAPARALAKHVIKKTGMASLPHFTHGSFNEILKETGFENIQVEEISRNVYPSWLYAFKYNVVDTLNSFLHGNMYLDIPGSIFIYPARSKLGYNVCQGTKPQKF